MALSCETRDPLCHLLGLVLLLVARLSSFQLCSTLGCFQQMCQQSNCGVMPLYCPLGKGEGSSGVISICDLRQDLHVSNVNKEQPVQNPTGRYVSEATYLQKVNLGFKKMNGLLRPLLSQKVLRSRCCIIWFFRWKNFKITKEKN